MYADILDFLSHVQSEQSYILVNMHICLMDIKSHGPQETLVYI